jgi:acetyl-CoA carboxylase carboxyltransferase component
MVRASGRVPQISVVLGPAAGGAAYGPALTDIVIMGAAGRIFVTGPEVVRSVTGEQVDMERLGGPSRTAAAPASCTSPPRMTTARSPRRANWPNSLARKAA